MKLLSDIRLLNRRMLWTTAPFLGAMILLFAHLPIVKLPGSSYLSDIPPITRQALASPCDRGRARAGRPCGSKTSATIAKSSVLYRQTNTRMNSIVSSAAAQGGRPLAIYDRRITLPLGSPSRSIQTDKLTAQLFYIHAQNFNGYALKVKLKQDGAMKLVLGGDEPGKAETTLDAVKRYSAIIGVNAGGFADDSSGRRYPLSTTVLEWQLYRRIRALLQGFVLRGIEP